MISMEELRSLYLAESMSKVQALNDALKYAGTESPRAAEELYRLFHNMSGSGGSYGLSYASDMAEKAKYLIRPYKDQNGPLPEETIEQVKNLIKLLDSYFSKTVQTKGEYIPERILAPEKSDFTGPGHLLLHDDESGTLLKKVLAVDDDEISLRLISWSLSREYVEVQRARSYAEALQMIKMDRPDLIILSPEMDGARGLNLLSYLKKDQSLQLIPVIIVSDKGALENRIAGFNAGANQYMIKPVHPGELIAAVHSEIDRNRLVLELIIHDTLTGAYSRRYIFERLREELLRHQRRMDPLCLAIIDLDHFKSVNDNYGHLAGDEILRRFVMFLKANLRSYDSVGRYGGEEFIVLMPNTMKENARTVLDRIRMDWANTSHHIGKDIRIRITFSVGLSFMDRPELRAEDLIFRADRALYCAKDQGRNRICTEDQ